VVHLTSTSDCGTFKQYALFVPFGLTTLILLATILLHTVELEQAKVAISGWYFLLVFPLKFLKTTFVMVRGDGYSRQRVRLD
jgi:hypothetical protein